MKYSGGTAWTVRVAMLVVPVGIMIVVGANGSPQQGAGKGSTVLHARGVSPHIWQNGEPSNVWERDKVLSQDELKRLDLDGVAMTAAVEPDGTLHPVGGLWEKLGQQAVELAWRGLLDIVVVAAEQDDIPERYLGEKGRPIRVIKAKDVADAIHQINELRKPQPSIQPLLSFFVLVVLVWSMWTFLFSPPRGIGVMPFRASGNDSQLEELKHIIRSQFIAQLQGLAQLGNDPNLKVKAREHIDFEIEKIRQEIPNIDAQTAGAGASKRLGLSTEIQGEITIAADELILEVSINDAQTGTLVGQVHVEGKKSECCDRLKDLALKTMSRLNIVVSLKKKDDLPCGRLSLYEQMWKTEGLQTGPPETSGPRPQSSLEKEYDELALVPLLWGSLGENLAWAGNAPEEEIQQVLDKYKDTYNKSELNPDQKLNRLESIFVSPLPEEQKTAIKKYFDDTKDLKVEIRDVDITINGNEAIVSYTRRDEFIDRESKEKVRLELRLTRIFMRRGDKWMMTDRSR